MSDVIFVAEIHYDKLLHKGVLRAAKENNQMVKDTVYNLFMRHMFCNQTKTLLTTLDDIVFGSGFHVRLSYIILLSFNFFTSRLAKQLRVLLVK